MRLRGLTRLAVLASLVVAACPIGAQTADYRYFFTATDAAFEAAMDAASVTLDAGGNKLVSVRLSKFSAAFRDWIKSNFPGGEMADFATDSYSIDCEAHTVGEHRLVWHAPDGGALADYDFGGRMAAPTAYSMKENLMKKVCGLP